MMKFSLLVYLLALVACSLTSPLPRSSMLGKHFQGDIKLTKAQQKFLSDLNQGIAPSSGVLNLISRWPKNSQGHVVVPYRMQGSEGFCKFWLQKRNFHISYSKLEQLQVTLIT